MRHKRFIPACAGNSGGQSHRSSRNSVHPRVCGEQDRRVVGPMGNGGSSPRVRGTVSVQGVWIVSARFIPACAGNSSDKYANSQTTPVHPRVCGEQSGASSVFRPFSGSSPRVRGTALSTAILRNMLRFIPACAGNSPERAFSHPRWPVHPRVCGEQFLVDTVRVVCAGSSPRVRGTGCNQVF